jgi:hypothetical protein
MVSNNKALTKYPRAIHRIHLGSPLAAALVTYSGTRTEGTAASVPYQPKAGIARFAGACTLLASTRPFTFVAHRIFPFKIICVRISRLSGQLSVRELSYSINALSLTYRAVASIVELSKNR